MTNELLHKNELQRNETIITYDHIWLNLNMAAIIYMYSVTVYYTPQS